MIKNFFISCFFLFFALGIKAAQVDTLQIYSACMKRNVEVITIVPQQKDRCPVLYLLHGYSGNARDWITKKQNLPQLADKYGLIIICPDGKNSWYWDSPMKTDSQYETFMTSELITYVDKNLPTIPRREARAITGLSMGGHGAMFLSMRHVDLYSAAGSMSGGLNVYKFPKNWKIKKLLGSAQKYPEIWKAHAAINQIERIHSGDLKLVIDCGFDDFFYKVNQAFHQKLWQLRIPHTYTVRPGGHTWDFWTNAIDYQLVFFKKHFDEMKVTF
jgi:S-formylglutathione hydrolase FrmB